LKAVRNLEAIEAVIKERGRERESKRQRERESIPL
jgi:hypothetical protein